MQRTEAIRRTSSRRRLAAGALLVVVLTACGGGGGDGRGDAAGSPATNAVAIENFLFMPDDIDVPAGTTVTWTNQDDNAHSIQDDGGLFPESDDLEQGQSFSHTYDTPGEYPYICGIHPYMRGTVRVS